VDRLSALRLEALSGHRHPPRRPAPFRVRELRCGVERSWPGRVQL